MPDVFCEFADIDKIPTATGENIIGEEGFVFYADANKHLWCSKNSRPNHAIILEKIKIFYPTEEWNSSVF